MASGDEVALRDLVPDWRDTSRPFLAEYRAEAGARLDQPAHGDLVQRLTARSEEFAAAWADHEIERFATRERLFSDPTVGPLGSSSSGSSPPTIASFTSWSTSPTGTSRPCGE